MSYIKNNTLSFGSTEDELGRNMGALFSYFYEHIPLDHDAMSELYADRECPISFDDTKNENWEINDFYRDHLEFMFHPEEDDKYIYAIKDVNGPFEPNHQYFKMTKTKAFIVEVHDYLLKNSPEKLILKGVTSVDLFNEAGINTDSRGVRAMDWKLYFWSMFDIERKTGIRLHDLIICAYKIRSHKFENWYELFGDIQSVSLEDGELSLIVNYDHGS